MSEPTPVGIYIHIPFCESRCRYCDFATYAGKLGLLPGYVDALEAEIRAAGRIAGQVTSIYFGGGTPSLLSPAQVGRLIVAVRMQFDCLREMEITLEANPGTIGLEDLAGFRTHGVNRLSLGIQSFRDENLRFLGRIHSAREAGKALNWAKHAGFDSVSADLIYGLPGQALGDWEGDIKNLLAYRPDHISLYGLTVEPNTPLGRDAAAGLAASSDDDAMADMYEVAGARLAAAGYGHYEISNWSLPGHESRHNLLCWRQQPYLGLGVAAHSAWPSRLAPAPRGYPVQEAGEDCWLARWSNRRDIEGYLRDVAGGRCAVAERDPVSRRLAMAEYVILGLRLLEDGVEAHGFRHRFGSDLDEVYGKEIIQLAAEGLLTAEGSRLSLSRRGMLLANEVSVRFLPESGRAAGSNQ